MKELNKTQEFVPNSDYPSDIKQRKIDFDDTENKISERWYKLSFVTPQERGFWTQQNLSSKNQVKTNTSLSSSLERSCYVAKESDRVIKHNKYSSVQLQKSKIYKLNHTFIFYHLLNLSF